MVASQRPPRSRRNASFFFVPLVYSNISDLIWIVLVPFTYQTLCTDVGNRPHEETVPPTVVFSLAEAKEQNRTREKREGRRGRKRERAKWKK